MLIAFFLITLWTMSCSA